MDDEKSDLRSPALGAYAPKGGLFLFVAPSGPARGRPRPDWPPPSRASLSPPRTVRAASDHPRLGSSPAVSCAVTAAGGPSVESGGSAPAGGSARTAYSVIPKPTAVPERTGPARRPTSSATRMAPRAAPPRRSNPRRTPGLLAAWVPAVSPAFSRACSRPLPPLERPAFGLWPVEWRWPDGFSLARPFSQPFIPDWGSPPVEETPAAFRALSEEVSPGDTSRSTGS